MRRAASCTQPLQLSSLPLAACRILLASIIFF
jgi:hypothetical protein